MDRGIVYQSSEKDPRSYQKKDALEVKEALFGGMIAVAPVGVSVQLVHLCIEAGHQFVQIIEWNVRRGSVSASHWLWRGGHLRRQHQRQQLNGWPEPAGTVASCAETENGAERPLAVSESI